MTVNVPRLVGLSHTLVLALSLSGLAPNAQALSFNIGEIEASFDSTLSLEQSWGTQEASNKLIGSANGGHAQSSRNDDGRLNFHAGEAFSRLFEGRHELELKYGDTGVFLSGKYWYDFELQDDSRRFKSISDSGRQAGAQSSGYELLDAYIYHRYAVGGLPGNVRLGKQVVNWGESTFIGNGIDSINPTDATALRRPGTAFNDAAVPVQMLYIGQNVTDRLSVDAFYQLSWQPSVAENCGTFFADDVTANGCRSGYTVTSAPGAVAAANAAGQMIKASGEGVVVPRGANRNARDSGQFGVALHWLGDDTRYGLYAMNYHSRMPILGTRTAGATTLAALPNLVAAGGTGMASSVLDGQGQYYLEYPENIRLFGASFATTLSSGLAWSGELSLRPDAPVQLNTADLTQALLAPLNSGVTADNSGYERKKITQLQSTLSQVFDNAFGADHLTLTGEAAVVHVADLLADGERYGRDAVYGGAGNGGFVTANAWGYRAKAVLDYEHAFLGIDLKPNLVWSHDVHGYGPNGLFNQGAKAVSVGVDADYQQTYNASLSYTDFFGGAYNTLVDRDYLSLSVGMRF